MSSKFYLQRTLTRDEETYNEAALLAASRYVVVLAEPGGGKTELLESFAGQLGCSVVTANLFGQIGAKTEKSPLVIDAFDELAKIDETGIYKVLGIAHKAHPTHLIISSRSSEWDNSATSVFEEFLGAPPLVVRLREFDAAEQQSIFEHHTPGENFADFQAEVSRFELDALLPNPQFLKLFADAYVESGRHFSDKRSIFKKAVERLTKEANQKVKKAKDALPSKNIAELASEVFAKLLLSGAEGVGTAEALDTNENRMYPLLSSLLEAGNSAETILATRLFKPGNKANRHRPVHKTVSEYCAADFLTKRIADPADPLTISKCLPIIAPNSTVRDELRGMLGWMASLGNTEVQEAAIHLDPYAVLANGDPSQLDVASKRLLIRRLKNIADRDPYFRRGDFWRRFSVAGFFTQGVVDEIKPLLTQTASGHLRDLLLEMLAGSPAIALLAEELRGLVLSPQEGENTRLLACNCLLDHNNGYDHCADLAVLMFEASQNSLKTAAKIIEKLGSQSFDKKYLSGFFRVCAHLYRGRNQRGERAIGARYFVRRLIGCLDRPTVEWLLDDLTNGLACSCGKKPYECDCRNGTSKIVGTMLDRYFELATAPYDPAQIWRWIGKLNFHENKGPEQSKSIAVLRSNTQLRRGIISHVFGALADRDEIIETTIHRFNWHSHSGLGFDQNDYRYVVDLAFDTDNPALWASFIAQHQLYRDKAARGPDARRKHMRAQASAKPAFMREWMKSNRNAARLERENRMPSFRHSRRMKRRDKEENEMRAANIKYVHENRELVEGGQHWTFLVRFADLVLMKPDKIVHEFGSKAIVRNALRNCLDFITPNVPDLPKLAELQCASQYQQSETILYAACLEILRSDGNLSAVPTKLLLALRTNLDMHYDAVEEFERDALRLEVSRLAFSTLDEAAEFCRQYIEPQLHEPDCSHPQVRWLSDDPIFEPLAPSMAFEWLSKFALMQISALDTLFEIAARHADREKLNVLIAFKCSEALLFWHPTLTQEALEARRTFWFTRAFYFLDSASNPFWDWLKADKDNVLLFNERSGRMNRSDHPAWPRLTSDKVEALLDAFFVHWPQVPLPSSWGTGSPNSETAYRFLTDVIWSISSDDPDDAIPTLQRLLAKARYVDLHNDMKSMLAGLERQKALRDFEPPSPSKVVAMLDKSEIVTVEGLRALLIDELTAYQADLDGSETTSKDVFYKHFQKGERLGEVPAALRIADRFRLLLKGQGIVVEPEKQMRAATRCDITFTKMIDSVRKLLVVEVKGQWHKELYTAAAAQLHERYSIHPDAAQQGVYLVLWFGPDEKIAGLKNTTIATAKELKQSIEEQMQNELATLVDVFVLDVSKK